MKQGTHMRHSLPFFPPEDFEGRPGDKKKCSVTDDLRDHEIGGGEPEESIRGQLLGR